MTRDAQVLIRLTSLEKEGFEKAAEISGIGLSAWARQQLRAAAIRELQEVGEQIVFLKPLSLSKKDGKGD